MRLASKFITLLLFLAVVATAVGAVYGFNYMLSAGEDPSEKESKYEIFLAPKMEIYSDRPAKLAPELFNASGMPVNARFDYFCESEAVSVAEDGTVTVLDPAFTGEVTVLVRERSTGIEKSITLRIVSELTYTHEVRVEGEKITEVQQMQIGETYRFELVTVPSNVALADYFDFFVTDESGKRATVFACEIDGNSVLMTANGLGSGSLHFVMKNEARGLYFEQAVDFSVATPDPVFGESILQTAGDTLIGTDELPLVTRVVFPADVTAVDFTSSSFFENLFGIVFTAEEMVQATALPDGTSVRVNGTDLYSLYVADRTWGEYADRIYPYLEGDHTRPVAVYHNAQIGGHNQIHTLLNRTENGFGFDHVSHFTYDYISATSPELSFGLAENGTSMPQYTLAGYRFVGWVDANGEAVDALSAVAEGIHLYAAWEANEITLTLEDYNAGELTYTVTYREQIGNLPKPQKAGWRFVGWYLSEDYENGTSVGDERIGYCMTEGVTLYAKYVTDVTLNYQTVEPGDLPTQLVAAVYGKPLADLPALADWYEWQAGGWYTSENYRADEEIRATDAFTYENADGITLYAKYTFETTFHTLSTLLTESVFEKVRIYSGLTLAESLAVEGREMPVCVETDAEKWRFDGWTATLYNNGFQFGELDSSSYINGDSLFQPGMTDIYPIFRSEVTLTAGINGETVLGKLPIVYGCYIGEITAAIPSISGFTTAGWYDETKHKLTATDIAFYDDGAATYAVWYNAIRYTITAHNHQDAPERDSEIPFWAIGTDNSDHVLNNNTGSGVTGRKVVLPLIPDLDGFTEYWNFELVPVAGPETLTASGYPWTVGEDIYRDIILCYYHKPNTYTFTFDVFGAPVEYEKTMDIVFMSNTKLPTPDAPEGYTFGGWYTDPSLADEYRYDYTNGHRIPSDVKLYAKYVMTVQFVGYGRLFAFHELVYGADYTAADSFFGAPADYNPETSVWRFVGWEDIAGNLITEGIADYRRTDTMYTAVFVRDMKLVLPDGFSLPEGMDTVTVRRGMTLREQNIVLPTDADVIKAGAPYEDWTLQGWYFWHPNMENSDHNVKSSDPVDIMDGAVDTLYADLYNSVNLNLVYPSGYPTEQIAVSVRLGFPLLPIFDEAAKDYFAEEYGRGYHHIGWKLGGTVWDKTQNAEEYGAFVAEVSHTFGTTFTAIFKPNPYTVIYDSNGGSDVGAVDVIFGDEITLAEAPTRLGYFFLGWKNPLTEELYAAGEVLSNLATSGEFTLIAEWRALKYNVVYEAPDADEGCEGIEATYGTPFVLPEPVRAHYNFVGWKFGGVIYKAGVEMQDLTAVEGDTVTLVAQWEPKQYKITFRDAQGNAHCVRIFTVEKRAVQSPMEPPAITGYIGAWEDYFERLATLTEDFEVQAVYTPITYTLKYEGLVGSGESEILTYDAESKITELYPPKVGYRFTGWSIDGKHYKPGDGAINLTAEAGATVLATPVYEIIVYGAIFYDGKGGEFARDTYTVEDPTVTPPAVPEKVGYTAKWEDFELSYGENGGNIYIYPFYDLITYTVEFYADGNFIASDTYTVEDLSITVPENGTVVPKTGYKDGRWPNFAPDAENPADVRVDALYTPISYTIVFDAFGIYYKEITLTYDMPVEVPLEIPEKLGHTFNGWEYNGTIYLPGQTLINLTAVDKATVLLVGDYRMHTYSVYYSNGELYTTVKYDEPVTLPMTTVVSKPGYTLKSWYINEYLTNEEGGSRFGCLTAEDNGKVVLQENWTENSYMLYLSDAYGNIYLEKTLMYTEVYILPGTPSSQRPEYNFRGWTYRLAGNSTSYGVGAGGQVGRLVTENGGSIVLTEQWTIKTPTVAFNYNGGSGDTSSKTVTYNSTYGALPTPNSRTNYTFNGWYTASSGGSKVTSSTTVTNYNDHVLYAQWTYVEPESPSTGPCVATGTEVLLADGTTKRIEEMTGDEMLLVWDFYTGTYVARPVLLLINHGEDEYVILNLEFSDGTKIQVVGKHTFYDMNQQIFVCIDEQNCHSYVGHTFAKLDGKDRTGVELVNVYVTVEYTGSYSIWSSHNINFITNNILSLTPTATNLDNFGLACDENMRFNQELLQADVEKYGLYTYEDWADCLTYEQYIAFNAAYMKIAVGKGLTTEEKLRALIAEFVNPATE